MWLILPRMQTKILPLAFITLFFKKSFLMLIVSLSSILTFNEHKRPRENKMFAFYILFQILLSMQCDDNSNNLHNIFHDPPNISDYQILLL